MDPISVLGLLASSAQLISMSIKLSTDLKDLSQKYSNCALTLNAIALECGTIEASVTRIRLWIEHFLVISPDCDRLIGPLSKSLDGCLASIQSLDTELNQYRKSLASRWKANRWMKLKLTLDDGVVRHCLEEIRWQANSLQLLLAVSHL